MEQTVGLTFNDIRFLRFNFSEYLSLLSSNHSCPQEKTIEKEKERGTAVIQNIVDANFRKVQISEEDFIFAQYFLEKALGASKRKGPAFLLSLQNARSSSRRYADYAGPIPRRAIAVSRKSLHRMCRRYATNQ